MKNQKHLRLSFQDNDKNWKTFEVDFEVLKDFISKETKTNLQDFALTEISYLESNNEIYTLNKKILTIK